MKEKIGKNLFITTNKMKRYLAKEHQKNELYIGQARILKYIYQCTKNSIYQKDLENTFQIRAGSVTGIIDNMVSLGLMNRVESTTDKRKKKIVLTDFGIEKAKQAVDVTVEFDNSIKSILSKDEYNNLINILNKIDKWIDMKEQEENETII